MTTTHDKYKGMVYVKAYDSFYDPTKLEWIDQRCKDLTCTYCSRRPPRPVVLQVIQGGKG